MHLPFLLSVTWINFKGLSLNMIGLENHSGSSRELWRGCLQIKDKRNLQSECNAATCSHWNEKKGASLLHRNFTRRNKIVMLQNLELRAPVHWFQTSENNMNTLAYSVSDGSAEFPWQLLSKRVSLTAPTVSNICKTEAKKNNKVERVWSAVLLCFREKKESMKRHLEKQVDRKMLQ